MDMKGDTNICGAMAFQLPVVVTAAETIAVGQRNDKDEEGEVISIPRDKAPMATIAAGDDEASHCHNNPTNDSEKYNENGTSDDAATPDHDSKQKRILPCMIQSILELLLSISFSFLLKLLFGGLCGIRTLFFVHVVNFVVSCLPTTEQRKWIPPQLQPFHSAVVTSSTTALTTIDKSSRISSWPPPTLIALGLFTIGTLIVHPDGYTWIVVHKIRDAAYFVMQSSTTCWAIAVDDYGAIVSTVLAMSTFATLFFFVYVLHRTLKSRSATNRQHQQNHKTSEKHKRKKRKHTNVRNNQKYTGRIRTVNDIDPDSTTLSAAPKDDSSTSVYPTETIQNDNIVQHVLPPLAEDEPLDSPPPTGASFSETVVSLAKYGSPQNHIISSRLRTASTSTVDSVAGSLDDQSSCSGRSTPTPVSVNESVLHPHFVTTPVKQSSPCTNTHDVRGQNGGTGSVGSTPNQSLTQNPRRSSNRRSGKKSSSQSSDVPTTVAASKSPPLTPSKRWDALKPANRTNTTRQQRQPLSRKTDRTETIHTDVTPRTLSDERQPPANDIAGHFALQNMTVATEDSNGLQHQTDYSFPLTGYTTQDYVHSAVPNDIRGANIMYDEVISNNQASSHAPPRNERIQFSGLNPNSNSWTGTLNIVPKEESYAYPPNSDAFHHGNGVFGFDVPRFQGVNASIADSLSHQLAPPKIENINDDQPLQFYTNEGVDTSSNEFSMQSELSTPSFDLSFLHNIPESNGEMVENYDSYNSMRYPIPTCTTTSSPLYVPTVDSTLMTMMMMTPDTSGTNASTPASSPYNRNYHYHHNSHVVRDNPFAESDDDDDQIEAKLLELGGQMVGSILDF